MIPDEDSISTILDVLTCYWLLIGTRFITSNSGAFEPRLPSSLHPKCICDDFVGAILFLAEKIEVVSILGVLDP